jgi:hypothetical protein
MDLAILRERHEGIAEINEEMRRINEIQKGECIWWSLLRGKRQKRLRRSPSRPSIFSLRLPRLTRLAFCNATISTNFLSLPPNCLFSSSDIALTVESQGDEVNRVAAMAVEASDRAASGLEELVDAQRAAAASRKQKREAAMAAIAALILVVLFLSRGGVAMAEAAADIAGTGSP